MKRLPWKYLAGFVDGEGCIDVQADKTVYIRPRLRINLTKSSEFILKIAQNSYGGNLCHRKYKGNANWNDSVSWELNGYKKVCPVLRNIVKHMLLKREQARLLLWLERNIKGLRVSTEVLDVVRKELSLMKHDPHRLSERAQEGILAIL